MTTGPPPARPTGFWIALPEGWVSIDVDPATAVRSAARLLDQLPPGGREHRADARRLLEQLAADSATAGVTFCACLATVVEGTLPLLASLTISVNGLDGAGNGPELVRASLAAAEPGGRTVDVVDLGAGPAVRRSGRLRLGRPGTDEVVTLVSRQFYVPVPGTLAEVALLAFASPTLELEAELGELFDGMAATFAFTW